MGKIFVILAFFSAMGLVVPLVNSVSPFAATATVAISNPLPSSIYQSNGGVTVYGNGTVKANATATAGGSGGIFGSIVSGTLLIFGNFFAAAQYLANLAVGVGLPYTYVVHWLTWSSAPSVVDTAISIAAIINLLCWVAYANEMLYIISGRWIFPP